MNAVFNEFQSESSNKDISCKVSKIQFCQGEEIKFDQNGITIVTGPNNSGKSQLLREIARRLPMRRSQNSQHPSIANNIIYNFLGNSIDLCEVAQKSTIVKENEGWFLQYLQQRVPIEVLLSHIGPHPQIIEAVLRAMLTYFLTSSRLQELRTSPIQVLGGTYGPNSQPPALRRMHEDIRIEKKLNRITQEIFGMKFIINRFAFHDSRPYLLDFDIPENIDRDSDELARWFESQPILDQQGDGVTAFCGILATIFADPRPLIVLDEPELFLHPPQIRQLAKIIATEAPDSTQVFVATHSDEFVRGMIEFGSERVNVIRITRNTKLFTGNKINILDSGRIEELWRDPLLKTSDALSSLFYSNAIVVEGDSDARFLRSMVDTLENDEIFATEIRFFHCGGKDRIHRIASAFRAIGITTAAVVDIDILDDKSKFMQLVESFGGDTVAFSDDFNIVSKHVMEKKSLENVGLARSKIVEILDRLDSKRPLTTKAINSCLEIFKSSNPWAPLKTAGIEAFDPGEPSMAIDRIITKSKSLGIIINRYGELESLWKFASGNKSQWLAAALDRNLKSDPKMKKARDFTKEITEVISQLNSRQA